MTVQWIKLRQCSAFITFWNLAHLFSLSKWMSSRPVALERWLAGSSVLWMALKHLLLKWKCSVGGEQALRAPSAGCWLGLAGRQVLCGSQTQHSCIGRAKLKIGKAHPVCEKYSCVYFSIYTFENGQQSSFPRFSPFSAFEACFRNSWSPTWILALPACFPPPPVLFGSGPHSSVSQTRDIVGESCLKLAFPFPHFEISVIFFSFILSCVVYLS